MVLPGSSFVIEFVRLVDRRIGGEYLRSTPPFSPKSLKNLINMSNHARQYLSYDYKNLLRKLTLFIYILLNGFVFIVLVKCFYYMRNHMIGTP